MAIRHFVGVALFVVAITAGAEQTEPSATQIEARNSAYILSVDTNSPGLEELNRGNYDAAIAVAASRAQHSRALSAHLVMCAAHIRNDSINDAQHVCDRAIELAQLPITTARNPHGHKNREGLAMAYSNRGVLRAVSGDHAGAKADFERALQQNRRTDVAIQNMRVSESTVRAALNDQ